jgi:hypothetical protein
MFSQQNNGEQGGRPKELSMDSVTQMTDINRVLNRGK